MQFFVFWVISFQIIIIIIIIFKVKKITRKNWLSFPHYTFEWLVLKDASFVFQVGVSYSMKKISSILSKWQEGLRLDRGTFIHTFSDVSTQCVKIVKVRAHFKNQCYKITYVFCSFIKWFFLSFISISYKQFQCI